jgi:hypothetical protein
LRSKALIILYKKLGILFFKISSDTWRRSDKYDDMRRKKRREGILKK